MFSIIFTFGILSYLYIITTSSGFSSPANKSDVQEMFFIQQMSSEEARNAGTDVLKATVLVSHGNTNPLPSHQPSKSNRDIKYGDAAMRGTIQFKRRYSVM